MSIFIGLANLIVGLTAIFRAKYFRIRGALKPVFVAAVRQISGNEILCAISVGLIILGVGMIWFPLAPICLGCAGLAVAVINARMR